MWFTFHTLIELPTVFLIIINPNTGNPCAKRANASENHHCDSELSLNIPNNSAVISVSSMRGYSNKDA